MADQARTHLQNAQISIDKVTSAVNRCNINLEDVRDMVEFSADQDSDDAQQLGLGFQQALLNLESDFVNLQDVVDDLPSQVSSLGMASFLTSLSALPPSGQEVNKEYANMYEQLISAYSSHDRFREYSAAAWNYISQAWWRKSFNRPLAVPRVSSSRAFYMDESLHIHIEKYVKNMGAALPGLASWTYALPGAGIAIELVVDKIFRVVILLRGLIIEAVNVRGAEEYFYLEKPSIRPVDLWTPSDYETYRAVAANANAALLHYYNPFQPDASFRSYLQWLNSFAGLFSSPCRKCGKYLDQGLPPTWRDYKRFDPFHDTCRSVAVTPI